ncbi:MAG TPA: arsenic resistance N-acetyltransferase ArsN2 [Opitutus sp.]|nr:arsenic resistance N-acetyltransferase ArsN2 [Opitutus sp.]
MMVYCSIEPAVPEDAPAIAALLRSENLPAGDFAEHLAHFLVGRSGDEVVAAVGAEIYGDDALLRSLVVAPTWRDGGVGGEMLRQLEARAEQWGVRRWWLLTTTAEAFFTNRGFRVTARSKVPAAIAATGEFRELCPATAVCLSRERRTE